MKDEYLRIFKKFIIPTVILCVAVGIVVMVFYVNVNVRRQDTTKDDLIFVAQAYADRVQNELEIISAVSGAVCDFLSKEEVDDAEIKSIMNSICESTSAYEVLFHKGEGVARTSLGKEIDISGCHYYERIVAGEDVSYIVANDEISGQEAIVVTVPVAGKPGQSLLAYYSIENLKETMNVSQEFNKKSFSLLMNADGDYLVKGSGNTNYFNGDNLWELVRTEENKSSVAGASMIIKNGNAGVLKTTVSGEERSLVYCPLDIQDWVFVIGVSQKYVDKQENGQWNDARTMLLQLLSMAVVYIFAVGVIDILGKKHEEEKNKLLHEKADTDLLTGLNNKLATETKIKEFMQDNPNELGMMFIIDLDDFKKINDTRGHAFGDEVLRSFGSKIGTVFRVSDIIGRVGGDEFIIFLKHLKSDTNAVTEAKKLENFFAGFMVGDYVKYSVCASIGAAVYPEHGADFESLYKAADKALYKAKQRGKNQLAFFDDRDKEPGK